MEFTLNGIDELGNPLNCGRETFTSLRAANEAARSVISDCEVAVFATETESGWEIPAGFKTGSVIVVINEQHTLLSEQERLLLKKFGSFFTLNVPAAGWNIEQQREVLGLFAKQRAVFVSPIPWLLKEVAAWCSHGYYDQSSGGDPCAPLGCFVMGNDNREKKELPGGKIIYTIPKEGWYIA